MPLDELRRIVGDEAVSTDPVVLREAAQDWWPLSMLRRRRGDPFVLPAAVARPPSADGVAAVLAWAQRTGTPVVPRGGGSGVCGAADPGAGAIVLDTRRLDQIAIEPVACTVTAGAGVMGSVLEAALNERGLTLGHFPQSIEISTVGGWVATRSAGQKSSKYGRIDDVVLGLEIALPGGRLVRVPARSGTSAGPDFARMFLGSEGTLGVITEVTLRVQPVPAGIGEVAFRMPSFDAALDVVTHCARTDVPPAVVRLYDEADALIAFREGAPGGPVLVLRFEGSPAGVAAQDAIARAAAAAAGGANLGPALARAWWAHRNDAVQTLRRVMFEGALGPNAVVDTIEVAGFWPVGDLYAAVRDALGRHADLVGCHASHPTAQGTCLYFTFVVTTADTDDEAERRYRAAWDDAMQATLGHGGTITHHHGVGLLRAPWIEQELGDAMGLWRSIKAALDPTGIMNPGKAGL